MRSSGIITAWIEVLAHSSRGSARAACKVARPTGRPAPVTIWQRRPVRKNFVDVVLHGHVARDGGNIARHDVGSADVGERVAHGYLHQAFLRRAQEETIL